MNKNTECEIGFGPHLTMDLYSCDKNVLNDEKFIYEFLDKFPELIGMTKFLPPHIINYPGREGSFDKGGISGFILIVESHITIHTFVEQRHAFIDIFSCKDFDIEKATEYIVEKFKPERIDKKLFGRGIEFPKNVSAVEEIVAKERREVIDS